METKHRTIKETAHILIEELNSGWQGSVLCFRGRFQKAELQCITPNSGCNAPERVQGHKLLLLLLVRHQQSTESENQTFPTRYAWEADTEILLEKV